MKTTIVHLPLHQFSSHNACMKKCYVVGYTKHFYLGAERIATALGEGGWGNVSKTLDEDETLLNKASDAIGKIHDGGKYGELLVDAIVKDERAINLCQTRKSNQSMCSINALQWNISDFETGTESVPSFITLSHEFAHFLSFWYKFADYGTWYMYGKDRVTNDEKWTVNVENLVRGENRLGLRNYYTMPSESSAVGVGEIPHWSWVKDVLEIICKF